MKKLFRRGNVVKSRRCRQAGADGKSRSASADRQTAAMQSGGLFCYLQRSFLPDFIFAADGENNAVGGMADGNCDPIRRIRQTAPTDQAGGGHLY